MKLLLAIIALSLAGCATPPAPAGNDPAVYRPAHRVTYPIPQ
jgi:type IV pilus biogenesis protein CpaD/CtpE